jgi:ubiquinone/menaquinone biosynthesis C-methylase UbiE
MSTYEDYDRTSASYDRTRLPIGVEILVGCFAQGPKRLAEMKVLDAGCGTGAYAQALLPFVGHVDAVDFSAGMLAVAAKKLAGASEAQRIAFLRADLADLPFEEGRFDGIMVNQVLHHVDAPGSAGYPKHEDVLRKLARLLAPGGALVINTCSHEQVFKGFWPSAVVPAAAARMSDRYMPIDDVERVMKECGLTCRGRFVPVDAVTGGDAYFDVRGPLRKEWRDGDSLWALATETELEEALQKIRDLDGSGQLDDFVARHDAERRNVGQVTFVFATRSRS